MSFDLGVFYTESPHTDEEAIERYIAYCEMDDLTPYIEPSEKVGAFLKELTDQYPQIDDWPEADIDECPWSIAFDVSEGHILMPMVFSRADEMYQVIVSLAEKHGLICVDPQSSRIAYAPSGMRKQEKPWWQFW
ncbi:hypothetical protein [Hahella ganghwensis]|uniref:hypothetical protein n=1 Tax=Hahella ganghwensis TaxID=286420 RepID=UPI000368B153|nr:hypothetical protein [Hahella ganghwensis]